MYLIKSILSKSDECRNELGQFSRCNGAAVPSEVQMAVYKAWIATVLNARHHRGEQHKIGGIDEEVMAFLKGKGVEPKDKHIWIDDKTVLHARRDSKVSRGAALTEEEIKQIPMVLAKPEMVLWDNQDPALLYVFSSKDSKNKIVVQVWRAHKKHGYGNRVATTGKVQLKNITNDPRYEKIK